MTSTCPSPGLHVPLPLGYYLRKGCRQESTVTTMSWLREVRVSALLPTGLGALRVRKATHAVMNCSCGRRGGGGAENTAHIHTHIHTYVHTSVHPPTWCSRHTHLVFPTHPPGVPDTPTWCSRMRSMIQVSSLRYSRLAARQARSMTKENCVLLSKVKRALRSCITSRTRESLE